jgi:hypothetical protein
MVIVVSYCRGGSSYDSHINVLTNDSILTRVGLFINYEIYKKRSLESSETPVLCRGCTVPKG